MSNFEYDTGYTAQELACPWCGHSGAVDYDDFPSGNGNQQETYCSVCEKPLITQVDYTFMVKKGDEK